jgi:hypothetical protein
VYLSGQSEQVNVKPSVIMKLRLTYVAYVSAECKAQTQNKSLIYDVDQCYNPDEIVTKHGVQD